MKITKFYLVTILTVVSVLIYIHQHIEIIRLNYMLKNNETEVAQLLDLNGALMYNIEKLENPYLLEEKLHSNDIVLTMPERWHVVKVEEIETEIEKVSSTKSKKGIFDFLVPKALAREKPTKQ